MKWDSLKGADNGLSEELKTIRDMPAGPWMIKTALWPGGKCMYIASKRIPQPAASDDWFFKDIEITFTESNNGGVQPGDFDS